MWYDILIMNKVFRICGFNLSRLNLKTKNQDYTTRNFYKLYHHHIFTNSCMPCVGVHILKFTQFAVAILIPMKRMSLIETNETTT